MAGRAERPVKRLRRLSTDYDESEGTDDWTPAHNKGNSLSHAASSGRPRRGVATSASSATIERTSPEETRQSIHLTVKAPPSKLREATSGSVRNVSVNSRDRFQGGEILSGPRGSRNKKVIVEESSEEEDEEEDEEAEEPEEMDEDEEEDEEEAEEDDEDVDAEGEDDVEMEDAPPPPPPVAKSRGVARLIKPSINVTPAPDIPGVEGKEMAMVNDDDDDEELSELESQDEEDEEDEEGGDEDAEGEDEEIVDDDADRDEDLDSDDETPQSISRSNTPDLSKLTRRQRAAFEEYDGGLIALSNEAQKKKHLTAEEHAMRRAEMARRRKNLSEKRNEEEKMDTINRLLKKQPPKRRGRAAADVGESGQEDEPEVEKASPVFVRHIQNANGSRIAVPEEWLSSPIGDVFTHTIPASGSAPRRFSGRMVEEVA